MLLNSYVSVFIETTTSSLLALHGHLESKNVCFVECFLFKVIVLSPTVTRIWSQVRPCNGTASILPGMLRGRGNYYLPYYGMDTLRPGILETFLANLLTCIRDE